MNKEFEKFDAMTRALLRVPHSEIKKKLEEEKKKKAKKSPKRQE